MILSTCDILVRGRNRELLIKRLKKRGVDLLDVKILNKNELIIKVKRAHTQKVFEISKNMWYNSIIAENGLCKVFSAVKNHLFLLIAALAFIIAVIFLSGRIIGTDLSEVDKGFRSRVGNVLSISGVRPFARVEDIDTASIENDILAVDGVSFASVYKSGFRLKVAITASDISENAETRKEKLVARAAGVVEDVTVYRGRAAVKKGDIVRAGDLLVDGRVDFDDQRSYQTFCSARVTVRSSVTDEYYFNDSSDETIDIAVASARLAVFGEEANKTVEITPVGEKFLIKVTIDFLIVYGA